MTAPRSSNSPDSSNWMTTLGWAAYLGMSWTWCIGMFLPVLLVRDYGIWGFVVFAVPNVVGAAAMGWVLRRHGSTERLLSKHRAACAAFSLVTIAFQIFFAGSLALPVLGDLELDFAMLAISCAAFVVVGLWKNLGLTAGLIVWGVSCVLLFEAWHARPTGLPQLPGPDARGLLWLAPICVFGFLLCPYLDLTFLHARQRCAGSRGTVAFIFGFGVLFLVMILGTLIYAPAAIEVMRTPTAFARTAFAYFVGTHIALQLGYTIIVHQRELRRNFSTPVRSGGLALAAVLALLAGLAAAILASQSGMRSWEVLYRLFMSFYGLLFPAYVWICMIPTRDGHSGIDGPRGRRKLIVLAVAVLLAAPCFWMGFIERQEVWLAPGLGVVLFARVFVRGSRTLNVPA